MKTYKSNYEFRLSNPGGLYICTQCGSLTTNCYICSQCGSQSNNLFGYKIEICGRCEVIFPPAVPERKVKNKELNEDYEELHQRHNKAFHHRKVKGYKNERQTKKEPLPMYLGNGETQMRLF